MVTPAVFVRRQVQELAERPRKPIVLGEEQKGFLALVAQQVERILGKDEVTGSNPVMSSNFRARVEPGSGFMCLGGARVARDIAVRIVFFQADAPFRRGCTTKLRGRESWQRKSLNVTNRT